MTSTSYWLPLDFWCPLNRDPLYKSDLVTPGCLELTRGGGGLLSSVSEGNVFTGMVEPAAAFDGGAAVLVLLFSVTLSVEMETAGAAVIGTAEIGDDCGSCSCSLWSSDAVSDASGSKLLLLWIWEV